MDLTVGLCDPASDPDAGLYPLPGVQLNRVLRFANNALWRTSLGGGEEPTHSAPSDYLCLAGTTSDGVAQAKRLAAEVAAATGIELPVADLEDLTKPNRRKALNELCVRALAARASQAERRVGHLAGALATLRREHEAILQRYAEIEANLVMHGQQPVQVLVDQKRIEAFAELGEEARLGRHCGLDLPFGTLGLYLLSLFIDAEEAEGPLDIAIETRGTHRQLARWTQNLRHEKADWHTFTRALALTESHSSARLLLAFRGSGLVRVGTGMHHPAKRIWLTGANGQTDPRHIAIRALATTPGLRAPEGANFTRTRRLWDIESVTQVTPSADDIPDLVGAAPEGGTLVTPVMGLTTCAGLGSVIPEGATAIRATGIVAHADGPLVDFALAAGRADKIADMVGTDQAEHIEAFSGWVTGAPMSPILLGLVLPEVATGQEELFLLTRISVDSSHDWCARAVFRNIQILSDRETPNGG